MRKAGFGMGERVLVGSTGFVGGNLAAAGDFSLRCHSTDVGRAFGRDNDLVIYAGVPAAMFLANRDPEGDLAVMRAARENLRRIAAKRTVLVSSICVYADSRGKTEEDAPDGAGLAAYGANRLCLERWVREDFPDALIVRLPALYGAGLKKNFFYDLHTVTPALLRPEKYAALAEKSELVRGAYADLGRLYAQRDAAELHAALGDQVDGFADVLVHLVEQFMQADEAGTFHVPVRGLGLREQIDGVGQSGVEQVDHLLTRFGRQVVFGLVHRIAP